MKSHLLPCALTFLSILSFVRVASSQVLADEFIDAPSVNRPVIDRKFVAFTAYQAAASVMDVESTIGMMRANPYCTEEWSAWFTGERPGRGRLYLGAALSNVAAGTLAYFLKRKGKSYWWIPQVSIGSLQVYTADSQPLHQRLLSLIDFARGHRTARLILSGAAAAS